MIAKLPRVAVDHRSDQFVDGATGCPWAAWASRVAKASPQVKPGALLEPTHPVVHSLSADLQQLGDFRDISPFGKPEQSLRPTSLLGQGGVEDETFQFAPLPVMKRD
jgi:predicted ATPase with chaperone activity